MSTRLYIRGTYPPDWNEIGDRVRAEAGGKCIRCGHVHDAPAGYALTVHHFDGDKANCEWWNLMALCQRCHLRHDAKHHAESSRKTREAKSLQPSLFASHASQPEVKP